MLTDDIILWYLSRQVNATRTITQEGATLPFFQPEHINDEGASSQKVPFFSKKLNNDLFGEDSFEITGNHNLKVNINNNLLVDRGSKFVEMDLSQINTN